MGASFLPSIHTAAGRTTLPKATTFLLAGGEPGATGRNLLMRRGSNRLETLGPIAMFRAEAGDVLRIETPGGGGYGRPG